MLPATGVVDRDDALLLVIDVQERLSRVMPRREPVIDRCGLLLSVAGIVGLPVALTRQYPKGLGDIDELLAGTVRSVYPESAPPTVDKVAFDCFKEPGFCDAVAVADRGKLIICGMETHICVAQTALSALREGFDVHVVADACCSREDAAHDVTLGRLAHAGAVVTTAESVAYELVGEAGTPEFKALLGVVKG